MCTHTYAEIFRFRIFSLTSYIKERILQYFIPGFPKYMIYIALYLFY